MLKKYGFKLAIVLSILSFTAVIAYTHSGRTDRYGGHHDRINGGYHYHNSGTVPRTSPRTPRVSTDTPSYTPRIPSVSTDISSLLSELEADTPYFPTQIEWLSLVLNAKFTFNNYGNKTISIVGHFNPNKNNGKITIDVSYGSQVTLKDRNDFVEIMKKTVVLETTRLGWQDWVKTEVKYEKL